MPELAEVETTVRDLRKKIINRRIEQVFTDWPKTLKNVDIKALNRQIKGKMFSFIERRGKNILLEIGGQSTLWIHLKMTGHLMVRPVLFSRQKLEGRIAIRPYEKDQVSPFAEKVNQYIHFRIKLDKDEELVLSDVRKFAKIIYLDEPITKELKQKVLADLGPEPLESKFNLVVFRKIIGTKKVQRKELKVFLLDQTNIAGIGNIYASEILFEARLNPRRKIETLKPVEIKRLFQAIKIILQKAVEQRGTSISDYRDIDGQKGHYGEMRQVYKRKGEPCLRCKGRVESFKQAGRSTFWCPKCQR